MGCRQATLFFCVLSFVAPSFLLAGAHTPTKPTILLFTSQQGEQHDSVVPATEALVKAGEQRGWDMVVASSPSTYFSPSGLHHFHAVVFLLTSGDVLDPLQRAELDRFVAGGGGWIGVHSAAETLKGWKLYEDLVGGIPADRLPLQVGTVLSVDRYHPSTAVLPERWNHTDEWLVFPLDLYGKVHPVALVDGRHGLMDRQEGAGLGLDYPLSWVHSHMGGRCFYTALGHSSKAWSDIHLVRHVMGGISWAAHQGHDPELESFLSDDVRRAMREDRNLASGDATIDTAFEKFTLFQFSDGTQPIQMAMAPDGTLFITSRSGVLYAYNTTSDKMMEAGELDIVFVNEDGLLGIAVDPNYISNGYVYIYYAPVADSAKNINALSRFTIVNGKLDPTSELRLLSIPTQRIACCHSGGHVHILGDYIYLSTGDNSPPTLYNAVDNTPGNYVNDAQKSAANTMDFRGKILRFKYNADGSRVPHPDNLFGAGDASHLPEIWVMGVRNPWTFELDPRNGDIWIGEVGPDAVNPDPLRGPLGLDEIHRFASAGGGNGGWPYCIGNNQPYVNQTTGKPYNCSALVNYSPNNPLGAHELPPATPAEIWYSYGLSADFPVFNVPTDPYVYSRAAMVGLVYAYDATSTQQYKLPAAYDNTVFFLEWCRNYMRLITMDANRNVLAIRPLWESFPWLSPLDIAVGLDGSLYVLEFGYGFNLQGAQLTRMRYTGKPSNVACVASATPNLGIGPQLAVQFSSTGSTPNATYQWSFLGNGKIDSTEANPAYTFDSTDATIFLPILTVTSGGSSRACTAPVQVLDSGNHPPVFSLDMPVEYTVFTWGDTIAWRIIVTDAEDGSTVDGTIPCSAVSVTPSLSHNNNHIHSLQTVNGCNGTLGPVVREAGWDLFAIAIQVQYTDRGGSNNALPIHGSKVFQLKPSNWFFKHYDDASSTLKQVAVTDKIGDYGVTAFDSTSYALYKGWNFFNLDTIIFRAASITGGHTVQLRMGSASGRIVASADITPTTGFASFEVPLQDTNLWFQVDMGAPTAVGMLSLDAGEAVGDFIRSWIVYTTNDLTSWGAPIDYVASGKVTLDTSLAQSGNYRVVNIAVNPPVTARYWKIVSTGQTEWNWWSIAELNAYGPHSTTPLPRLGWAGASSIPSTAASLVAPFDGNVTSRWSTNVPQLPGLTDLYVTVASTKPAPYDLVLNYFLLTGAGTSNTLHAHGFVPNPLTAPTLVFNGSLPIPVKS